MNDKKFAIETKNAQGRKGRKIQEGRKNKGIYPPLRYPL